VGREGVSNVQDVLYKALVGSGGRLLVESRSGMGKTREVAELAARLCDEEDWTVCVATGNADALMGAPAAFPGDLRGRRVLFVLDDLHQRVVAGSVGQEPYSRRLNAFLEFFDRAMSPGEMCVVATARTEPHHQKQLGFDPTRPLWSRFKVYELPEFTLTGLGSMLMDLAGWAKVDVAADQVNQMVSNSDRTLRTLVANVDRARRRRERLTLASWLPTQGRSWETSFAAAGGRWPDVERVYQALHLIREAGVPVRFRYVAQLGTRLGGAEATAATEGLVDFRLLGLRGGLVDVFGDEQLGDSLRAVGRAPAELALSWEPLTDAIVAEVKSDPDWSFDLVTLARELVSAERHKDAESTATAAINYGQDLAYPYRSIARYFQDDYAGAEADLTAAIERDQDRAGIHFLRGRARYARHDFRGAEADFTTAVARGQDDAEVYFSRGMARYEQCDYGGAEADLGAAIERGRDDTLVYYYRGMARFPQGNVVEVEGDLTAAIDRGRDAVAEVIMAYFTRGRLRYQQGNYAGAEADSTAVIEPFQHKNVRGGLPPPPAAVRGLYIARGGARFHQDDYAGADADFTAAINGGEDGAGVYFLRGKARHAHHDILGADADFTAAIDRGRDGGEVYLRRAKVRWDSHDYARAEADFESAIARGEENVEAYLGRGLARALQGNSTAAEADFTTAIARGWDDASVYSSRGTARYAQENYLGAETDFTAAIERGQDTAAAHYLRGLTRYARRDNVGAESDFTEAIERGQDDGSVYYQRGMVRCAQRNYEEGEKDLTTAIARGRDDARIYFLRGKARYARYDNAGAKADFTAAIERGQDDAKVYFGRAKARFDNDDYSGAQTDFAAAIERGQDDAGVYSARACTRVRLKQFAGAKQDCERAEKRAPADPSTHGCWGNLHLALGEYDAAVARYQSALAAASDTGWHFELGLALLLAGRDDEAKAAHDKGLTEARAAEIEAALDELDSPMGHGRALATKEAANAIRQKLRGILL